MVTVTCTPPTWSSRTTHARKTERPSSVCRSETVGARLSLLGDLQPFTVALVAIFVATSWGNEVGRIGEGTSWHRRVIQGRRLSC